MVVRCRLRKGRPHFYSETCHHERADQSLSAELSVTLVSNNTREFDRARPAFRELSRSRLNRARERPWTLARRSPASRATEPNMRASFGADRQLRGDEIGTANVSSGSGAISPRGAEAVTWSALPPSDERRFRVQWPLVLCAIERQVSAAADFRAATARSRKSRAATFGCQRTHASIYPQPVEHIGNGRSRDDVHTQSGDSSGVVASRKRRAKAPFPGVVAARRR